MGQEESAGHSPRLTLNQRGQRLRGTMRDGVCGQGGEGWGGVGGEAKMEMRGAHGCMATMASEWGFTRVSIDATPEVEGVLGGMCAGWVGIGKGEDLRGTKWRAGKRGTKWRL
mgnify:CR=1 FL=1